MLPALCPAHALFPFLLQDKDGNKVEWGGTPYADIFGPDGWCNSEKPTFSCPCRWARVCMFTVPCVRVW